MEMGEKRREYITPVCWEDGAFVMSARQDNDTFLCVLYGDMRMSYPIFIFEVIGNIYDNPEVTFENSPMEVELVIKK